MVLFLDEILKYPVKQLRKLELMSRVDFLYRGTLDQKHNNPPKTQMLVLERDCLNLEYPFSLSVSD